MNLSDLPLITQDLPKAKNIYDWVVNRNFLSWKSQRNLFPRQLGIAVNLFSEYCPYCSDVDYVKQFFNVNDSYDEIFNKVTLLEHDICPKCGRHKIDLIREGKLKSIRELAGMAGQRSGMFFLQGVFASYYLHQFLTRDLTQFFKIPNYSNALIVFVSDYHPSKDLCSNFNYLLSIVNDCEWFNRCADAIRLKVNDKEAVEIRCDYIKFGNIVCKCKSLKGLLDKKIEDSKCVFVQKDFIDSHILKVFFEPHSLIRDFSKYPVSFGGHRFITKLYNCILSNDIINKINNNENDTICPTKIIMGAPICEDDFLFEIYDNCNKEDNIRFKFTTCDINPEMPEDCEYVKATYKKDFIDAAFIFNDYHFLKEFNHFIKRF